MKMLTDFSSNKEIIFEGIEDFIVMMLNDKIQENYFQIHLLLEKCCKEQLISKITQIIKEIKSH